MIRIEKNETIGIVGGMGPQAGLVLFNNILTSTNAKVDQEHYPIILMSLPGNIVDRTKFLDGEEDINPAISIVKIIRKLENAGAKIIGIACNTTYSPAIWDVISAKLKEKKSKVTVVNMPFETCKYINQNYKSAKRIGLMATNGTYKSNTYKTLLMDYGYKVIVPSYSFQDNVIHKMIYDKEFGIKSDPSRISDEVMELKNIALTFFKEKNVDTVILGCTELSLAIKNDMEMGMVIVDSMKVLAKALIWYSIKNHNYNVSESGSVFPYSIVEGNEY